VVTGTPTITRPTASSNSGWGVNGDATAHEVVDDVVADDDATNILGGQNDLVDLTFNLGTLPGPVSGRVFVRTSQLAGAPNCAVELRELGGTLIESLGSLTPTGAYEDYEFEFTALTEEDVLVRLGMPPAFGVALRVTQVYVEIDGDSSVNLRFDKRMDQISTTGTFRLANTEGTHDWSGGAWTDSWNLLLETTAQVSAVEFTETARLLYMGGNIRAEGRYQLPLRARCDRIGAS